MGVRATFRRRAILLASCLALAAPAGAWAAVRGAVAAPADGGRERLLASAGSAEAAGGPSPEIVLPPPPLDAPRVAAVEIEAPPGEDEAALAELVVVESEGALSRRAVRRSVQRLYETGRFAEVTARRIDREDGSVVVRFVLEPRRVVRRIRFSGNARLDESALREAMGLEEGDEYAAYRIEAALDALRAAYARVGYEQAEVEAHTSLEEAGVDLALVVREGPPTRLAGIRFVGDPGSAGLVRGAISLEPGDVLDLGRLESDLERLRQIYRRANHWRVRVGSPRVRPVLPGLAEVEIAVQAGPRIQFAFRGNRVFGEASLLQAMAWDGEEQLDEAMLRELADRIEKAYRLAGWFDARVVTSEVRSPDGSASRILFHIQEGRPLFVAEVRFEGNREIGSETLRSILEQVLLASEGPAPLLAPLGRGELDAAFGDETGIGPTGLDRLHVYDDELYGSVVEALAARYRDEGFLEAEVGRPLVRIDERSRIARIAIPVQEGRRTRIARVEIPGAEAIELRDFLATVPALAVGRPLSEQRLREARFQLQSMYARLGYLYATTELVVVRPPEDPWAAVVRFEVEEGPQVRVGRIVVQGNRRTADELIADALLFEEGGVLRSDALSGSQQRLMRLGIFRTVAIRPLDPELPEPVKDLVIDLRERPKRSLEIGGGASIADGPRAFVEFTERNIFGRNLELGLHGRVNYQVLRQEIREMPFDEGLERYVDLGLRYPRIYGLPIDLGWRADLIHERDIRPAYELTRYAFLTGFDWPLGRHLTASVLYEFDWNTTARSARLDDLYGELSRQDLERLRFPEGTTFLGSLRPGLTLDLRNDPVAPRSGLLVKLEGDYASSLSGDPVEFLKLAGTVTGYVPLGRRSSLALSVGGGRIVQLDDRSATIWPKRFFLGGASTLRGFTEDGLVPEDRREELRRQISDCQALVFPAGCTDAARFLQQGIDVPSDGGDLYVLGRAELRFPLRGDLMGGVFLEGGNLWLDPDNFDLTRLRPVTGLGLRYGTPVGPVALDLGVNLDPDETLNEDRFALHFSIGLF